jgi:hypothetical protein
MTTAGYPKLRYRKLAGHQYELFVQPDRGVSPVQIGVVRRYGSLPSMQAWKAQGNWPGAKETRSRQLRGDAGADLWSEWNTRTEAIAQGRLPLRDMTPAERRAAIGRAMNTAAAELDAAAPAIAAILDGEVAGDA